MVTCNDIIYLWPWSYRWSNGGNPWLVKGITPDLVPEHPGRGCPHDSIDVLCCTPGQRGTRLSAPFGWTIFTLVLANIAAIMGWGDWFPWAVPGLFSGAAGPRTEQLGLHSYVIVILSGLLGLAATFLWWRNADQTR